MTASVLELDFGICHWHMPRSQFDYLVARIREFEVRLGGGDGMIRMFSPGVTASGDLGKSAMRSLTVNSALVTPCFP